MHGPMDLWNLVQTHQMTDTPAVSWWGSLFIVDKTTAITHWVYIKPIQCGDKW